MKAFRVLPYLFFISVVFTNCTHTYVIPGYQSPEVSKAKTKGSKWLVYASPSVNVIKLVGTFEKVYIDKYGFADVFTSTMTDTLKTLRVNAIHSKKSANISQLENDITSKKILKSRVIQNDTIGPDFIAYVSNIELNSYWRRFGSGSVEAAVISFKFQLIDCKTNNEILSFQSSGECRVSFYDYANIVKQAVVRSISHAKEYIKSGKTEYVEIF